jgi:TolB-like protein
LSFWVELRRRNVFKAALFYIVTAWLLLQAGDVLFALLGLPDWTLRLVLAILVLGFPLTLIFSWIYELTPEGLKRGKDVDLERSITRRTGRKLNRATIVVASVAIVLVISQQVNWSAVGLLLNSDPELSPNPQATATSPDIDGSLPKPKTVAVLPFVDMSPNNDQGWIGDSITTELQIELSRHSQYQVLSRSSSFALPEQSMSSQQMGERLGVDVLVEGTFRRIADRIRVTVQLVSVESGYQLWSDVYESQITDDFSAEVAIAEFFSTQVGAQLSGPMSSGVQFADLGDATDAGFTDLFGPSTIEPAADGATDNDEGPTGEL